jgi:hypothetical protein
MSRPAQTPRLWPAGTPAAEVPPLARGISWHAWLLLQIVRQFDELLEAKCPA